MNWRKQNDHLVSSSIGDLVVGQVHLRSYMGHPVVGQFEFRDAGKMERKNGDVALRPHFSEVPKTKNRDTGLRPHFSSGLKFKMTHLPDNVRCPMYLSHVLVKQPNDQLTQ